MAKLTAALAAMSSERAQMQQLFQTDRRKLKNELETEINSLKEKLRYFISYENISNYFFSNFVIFFKKTGDFFYKKQAQKQNSKKATTNRLQQTGIGSV